MSNKEYAKAEMILEQHSKHSAYFKNKLAKFYSYRGEYKKSSAQYMNLYRDMKIYRVKRRYFLKALDSLQAGKHSKEAVDLASKYESKYINDKKIRMYILKLYISSGNLDKAKHFANKLLKKR